MGATTTTSRLNQEQAASALGVTVKTLRTWQKSAAWFPAKAHTRDGYDVVAIAGARPRTASPDEQESPLRKAAREAEHVKTIEAGKRESIRRQTDEIKLRTAQGELIPRLGIEQSYSDLLTGIADWCEQLPDVFVSMLSIPKRHHKACRNLLKQLIEQRQHELRDELEAKALARNRDKPTDHG